jgi:hypothetical protein
MNRFFRSLSVLFMTVLLVGGFSTFAGAATAASHQPQIMRTITGKVTPHGGLISQHGTHYLLYGYKASGLRNYANRTVTVTGVQTRRAEKNIITVAGYKAGKSMHVTKSEQTTMPGHTHAPASKPGNAPSGHSTRKAG